jgi:hypothetical protein
VKFELEDIWRIGAAHGETVMVWFKDHTDIRWWCSCGESGVIRHVLTPNA